MIELYNITKNQAIEAANDFIDSFARWTDCIFDDYAGSRLLKLPAEEYANGDGYIDDDYHKTRDSNRAKTNFSKFTFVIQIDILYEFALTGHWFGDFVDESLELKNHSPESQAYLERLKGGNGRIHLSDVLTELSSFLNVFTSRPYLCMKDGGTPLLINNTLDILLTVTHAARARFNLMENCPLTLEDVAMLADVNIKTVRNAVSSKGQDRLVLAGGKHEKPIVDGDEAYRWLLTKKGFTGPFLYDEEPPFDRYETLGQFRHHCYVMRTLAKLDISELAKNLDWNESLIEAYTHLEKLDVSEKLELLTPNRLMEIGKLYQSKYLNTFVVEGSRILAAVVAEHRAKQLFN